MFFLLALYFPRSSSFPFNVAFWNQTENSPVVLLRLPHKKLRQIGPYVHVISSDFQTDRDYYFIDIEDNMLNKNKFF